MSNEVENVTNEQATQAEEPKATVIVEQEGTGKKVVKWLIKGVVVAATAVLSFLAGRASAKDDKDTTETTDEKPAA